MAWAVGQPFDRGGAAEAEILGARVTATNLPCGGAEFSVSLPRVHVERPPETAATAS